MGNDNMVQNQKVFIRLEKVLELQRFYTMLNNEVEKHRIASKQGSKEALAALDKSLEYVNGLNIALQLLELPITL